MHLCTAREQWNMLACMISGTGGWVVPVVGSYEQQIVLAESGAQRWKRFIELTECTLETGHITAVAVQSVEIYKVGEQQPTLLPLDPFPDQTDAFGIVGGVARGERPACKEVIDFSDPCPRDPCGGQGVK